MSNETTQPDEMTALRNEYDQYCRMLGELSYVLWVTKQEIQGLLAKMAERNKKAAELNTPKEPSDGK